VTTPLERRLENVLAALRAFDTVEAARLFEEPMEGPPTQRARELLQACVDAMPAVMHDWQRRVNASLAARAYEEGA
jgi:hypothetical protein